MSRLSTEELAEKYDFYHSNPLPQDLIAKLDYIEENPDLYEKDDLYEFYSHFAKESLVNYIRSISMNSITVEKARKFAGMSIEKAGNDYYYYSLAQKLNQATYNASKMVMRYALLCK